MSMGRIALLLAATTWAAACIATAPEGIRRHTDEGAGGETIDFQDASTPDGTTTPPTSDPHAVLGVDPGHGPFSGGDKALIAGKGFSGSVQVWFGDTLATNVIPINPGLVQVDVPAGPGGPADVTAQNGSDESTRRTLPAGYTYDPLYAVPATGPVAGGTVIALHGQDTDWNDSTEARIDQQPCTSLAVVSATELSCTVPQGTPGAKTITVITADQTIAALEGYTYQDSSEGFKGGLSGAPLAGSLTVMVFNNYTGNPIAGAHVVVGSDLATALVEQTDSSGLALFDDPSLTSPHTVTVAALCHSPISFVDVPVDTVIAYLDPMLTPQCAAGGDPPPVGGKPVSGGGVFGELYWEGGAGEFQKAPWTNVPAPSGQDEHRVAYLFFATSYPEQDFRLPSSSYAVSPTSPGDIGYEFSISAYPGNHVLYALAGIQDDGVSPPRFTAYAMGTISGVGVAPSESSGPVYISMAHALDQALTVDVSPPPTGPKGPDRLHATVAIELGQSRYAILPGAQKSPLLPLQQPLQFIGVPPLDGSLFGARYVASTEAVTGPSYTAPMSVIGKMAATSTAYPIDMTGFVAVPLLQTPEPGGPWDGRHLAVEFPAGGWPPDLTVYEITSSGGLAHWLVAVPAGTHSIELPDLTALPDAGLPSGPLVIGVHGARIDGFDYGSVGYANLRTSGMDAYSLDYFNTHL